MSPSGYSFTMPIGQTTPSTTEDAAYQGAQYASDKITGKSNKSLRSYSDFNGDYMGYLQYLADSGDEAAIDKLMNYFLTERSNQIARDWTASREDSSYQRLVSDMKKAGLNPYAFATMGANPISSSSSGSNYSGSYLSSYSVNKEKNQINWLKAVIAGFVPIVGGIIAALG